MPARDLPLDPNLEHLHNQAKALHRCVHAGDGQARATVREFHPRMTRSDAEMAGFTRADAHWVIARRYGFRSWNHLRRHAEVDIRPIDSATELAAAFDVVGAQAQPPLDHTDRRFLDQARRFPTDRALMFTADHRGRIIGGGFAFRHSLTPGTGVTLRLVAVHPAYHDHHLERRLVGKIEHAARGLGAGTIVLGGATGAEREFYRSLGYHGRHDGGLLTKALPRSAAHRNPDGWHDELDRLRSRRTIRLASRAQP